MFEILLLSTALAAELPSADELLRQADAPRLGFLHSTLRVRATVEQEDGANRSTEFDLLIGDENQQLVVFRDKRNKGRKFLMVGDKAWLVVPGSKHPIAVNANQRILGASSFADLARIRLSRDYTGQLQTGMQPCGEPAQPCRLLDIQATLKTAPYAAGTLWIDGSGRLRQAIYKLASGKPAKEIIYRYQEKNGDLVLSGLTLTDLLLPDKSPKTVLEYLDRHPVQHPPSTFDPQQQLKR